MADLFKTLKDKLDTIEIAGETLWIAEGDTLLDEKQLKAYAKLRDAQIKALAAARMASAAGMGMLHLEDRPKGLVAMTKDGQVVRWKKDTVLTYRVARDSFGAKQENYELVVASLKQATLEWEATCGVNFRHAAELDTVPGTGREGQVFVVRQLSTGGRVIAASFFPSDKPARRTLIVDPSYYTANYDKVGIFRHELGHILGFRHEHVRSEAPSVCHRGEALGEVEEVTEFDGTSVMHYFCGGQGSRELKISALDRKGAQRIYGPPLEATQEIDPAG